MRGADENEMEVETNPLRWLRDARPFRQTTARIRSVISGAGGGGGGRNTKGGGGQYCQPNLNVNLPFFERLREQELEAERERQTSSRDKKKSCEGDASAKGGFSPSDVVSAAVVDRCRSVESHDSENSSITHQSDEGVYTDDSGSASLEGQRSFEGQESLEYHAMTNNSVGGKDYDIVVLADCPEINKRASLKQGPAVFPKSTKSTSKLTSKSSKRADVGGASNSQVSTVEASLVSQRSKRTPKMLLISGDSLHGDMGRCDVIAVNGLDQFGTRGVKNLEEVKARTVNSESFPTGR